MDSEGSVKLFSTIGLLYIMFIAGLELDMNEFKKYLNKSIVFGALTFFIPIILGYPICRYGLGLNETASWLTASMFATHTLVAYPIASKYGLTKKTAVAIAVGGTILTDTSVLILLAVISGTAKGEVDMSFWVRLITSLVFFSLIMFLIIPRVTKWFFKKLETDSTSQYIYVLSVVFFSAFLAEVAGVEHIIGAFVAGLVLNRLIPHNSVLMNRIEFIGNSLFIPFFLIYVGMVVDYKVLINGSWALIIAGVLTTFAIASKWLAAFTTQKIFGMLAAERQLIFGLSTAHAAATLAVIMVGFDNQILDINIVNATILLILITCMTASFATENAGKRYLLEGIETEQVESIRLRDQHLLVELNELKGNENLLDFSVMISNPKVVNPISVATILPNDEEAEIKIHKARKSLDEIIKHLSAGETKVNAIATIDHNISSGIARLSKELFADAVLINDENNLNIIKRLVGDDREHLLDVCDRTVFFCKLDKPNKRYEGIDVVAPKFSDLETSFSSWAERIIRFSKEINQPIDLFCSSVVAEKWILLAKQLRITAKTKVHEIDDPEDYFLMRENNPNTLCVYCVPRKGSVSYGPGMENVISRMQKLNLDQDHILIYPAQRVIENMTVNYDGFNSGSINKGVEKIQQLTKEVGNLFKVEQKNNKEDH